MDTIRSNMDPYSITFQTWNKVASLYQDKFMDLDLYNDTYDRLCREIGNPHPHILEIGCGPGNITRYLLSQIPACTIEAIDVAPNMIQLAKANNPAADCKVMDARQIDRLTSKFDAIVCGFCMPYLSKEDCAKLIGDSSALLNNGGLFYFSIIEGDYQKSGYVKSSTGDQTYLYYHQEDYLQEALKASQFELIDTQRKEFAGAAEAYSTHLVFIARKT